MYTANEPTEPKAVVRASAYNAGVLGSVRGQADFLLTRFLIELGSVLPNKRRGASKLTRGWSRYHQLFRGCGPVISNIPRSTSPV